MELLETIIGRVCPFRRDSALGSFRDFCTSDDKGFRLHVGLNHDLNVNAMFLAPPARGRRSPFMARGEPIPAGAGSDWSR
jgi:hypothetical protein